MDKKLSGALEVFKQTNAKEAGALVEYVQQVEQKNLVALGTDNVFALRDSSGDIKCFKQNLVLSERDGTLIQTVFNGPFVISAQGYEVWQESAGAVTIFPEHVMVDGKAQQNPHVFRDPNNQRILSVYARAVSFRFSSKGIPMVSDWTTFFDINSYRMIDLLAKAKKFKQAFRLLPQGILPDADDNETWASYPFDESTTLWINTSHEEALQWYGQMINREKKALDFAQTFAKRNSLKHLSGLQKSPTGNAWSIAVYCWRPTGNNIIKWDATQYKHLQAKVQGIITGEDQFNEPVVPQITTGSSDTTEDESVDLEPYIEPENATNWPDEQPEAQEAPETEETGDAQGQPKIAPGLVEELPKQAETEAPAQEVPPLTDEEQKIIKNCEVARTSFAPQYQKACDALKIDRGGPLSAKSAEAIVKKIGELLDEEAGNF